MDALESAKNDLKIAVDDLVYEIRKNRDEITEIKKKLGMNNNNNDDDRLKKAG